MITTTNLLCTNKRINIIIFRKINPEIVLLVKREFVSFPAVDSHFIIVFQGGPNSYFFYTIVLYNMYHESDFPLSFLFTTVFF